MYCNNCGKEISNDSKHCKYCGASVVSKDEAEKIEKQKAEKRKQHIEKMAGTDTIIGMASNDDMNAGFWPQLIAALIFPFYVIIKCIIGLVAYKGEERVIYFKKLAKNLITCFLIFAVLVVMIVGLVLYFT